MKLNADTARKRLIALGGYSKKASAPRRRRNSFNFINRVCLFLNGKFELSQFRIKVNDNFFSSFHLEKRRIIDTQYYAADGGLNHILKNKFSTPNLFWVGDGDSLNEKSKNFLKKHPQENKVHLNRKKDMSDLAFILDMILEQAQNNRFYDYQKSLFIEIYGGLGKRRDHELANIEEIKRFLSLLPNGGTAFFHGGVVLTTLPVKFLQTNCRFFSVFANNVPIEIQGACYSGCFLLKRPSHGLSNEIINKVFSITPKKNGVISLYLEE